MAKTTIEALEGDTHALSEVRLRNTETEASETRDIQHVFMMTGADPNTEWLQGGVALDAKGFIKTGARSYKTAGLCTGLLIRLKRAFPESSRSAISDLRA